MGIEIHQNWPIVVLNPPKERAVQLEDIPKPPSPHRFEYIHPCRQPRLESNSSFEKGMIIDIYV